MYISHIRIWLWYNNSMTIMYWVYKTDKVKLVYVDVVVVSWMNDADGWYGRQW